MNQIIIAAHSKLAKGILDAISFFKPGINNVETINAYIDDTDFEEDFIKMIEKYKDKNIIVLTDLIGGSINQIAFKNLRNYKYQLISGVNLPLALEIVFATEDIDDEFIENAIKNAQKEICYMNKKLGGR